jgi:single-stranded-DNA-specific exonuclease
VSVVQLSPVPRSVLPVARDPAVAPDPAPRLALAAYDITAALALERALGIGHVLAQVLVRRGLTDPVAARAFLGAGEAHDPHAIAGIDGALRSVRDAIAGGRRITVHGDYDVDGVCATAIMVRALRCLGAEVDWFIPRRLQDGYGLAAATVERLAARGTDLILTVDCAITAVEEVALARSLGMEVVVTDHHAVRADGRLPDCPLVHPAVGGYPCPELCGTAVAHKLALALGAPSATDDAELVALATVADLVPLVGENRRLVREGLHALAITAKPGLRALMAVANADPGALDTSTLGFRLAPRINAAGRLARADAGLELLLCEDPVRAAVIAAELDAVNVERRAVEQRILWAAEAQVAERRARAEHAGEPPPSAYVLAGADWHPGVVGIVASRIVERHHRPAVLIALDLAAGTGTGSGRSIPGFDLLGGLHAAEAHLGRYGGHRAAAGLSLEAGSLDAFRESLEAHAAELLTPELLVRTERADAVVSGGELGLELAEELEALAPCGLGNPAPALLIPGARFDDVRAMGEGRHARFSVVSGGVRAKAVAFGCDGRVGGGPGESCDATFRLERNAYNGAVEPRLVLRHHQPCAPAAIARLDEDGDYLAAVLAELEAELDETVAAGSAPDGAQRAVFDRRGDSPLAVLTDAVSGGRAVLALCADVPRRAGGLGALIGGFTLAAYGELERRPRRAAGYDQLVALDPPSCPGDAALLGRGAGVTHWAWGPGELRFAEQIHEHEYGLRPSLTVLYRALRDRERAAGEELERLLRGDGPHGRSARLASRLIRVLVELELVSLDRNLPALAIAGRVPTALERSPSFRVYAKRYEDGKRFLSSAKPPPNA